MTGSTVQDNTGLAILLTLCGFFVLSCSDMLAKYLGGTYHFLQMIAFLPTIAAIVLFLAAVVLKKRDVLIAKKGLKWQIVRGLMMPIGSMSVLYALPKIPLSSFYSIVFSAPIITSVLSIIFLKEKVYWQRWAGIICGFIGVMVVIRPGFSDVNPALFLVLISASLFSIAAILIRKYNQTNSAIGYAFVTHVVSGACCILIFLLFGKGFVMPTQKHALLFLICGAGFGLGGFLISKGIMLAQASIVAPFHYTQLIWGIIFGYFIFNDLPDMFVVAGGVIVIASGLYIWHRENLMRPEGQRTVMLRRAIVSVPIRKQNNDG